MAIIRDTLSELVAKGIDENLCGRQLISMSSDTERRILEHFPKGLCMALEF